MIRVVVGYSKPRELRYQSSGDGGVDELVNNLFDNEVQYALVRIPILDGLFNFFGSLEDTMMHDLLQKLADG